MITTNNEYKQNIWNNRDFIIKVTITLKDGTALEAGADIIKDTFNVNGGTSDNGTFTIGAAVIGQCKFSLNNYEDKYTDYAFEGAIIKPSIGLVMTSGTEWLDKGKYTIDTAKSTGSLLNISALDDMHKANKEYTHGSYPATIGSMVLRVANQCGFTLLGTLSFDNMNYTVKTKPEPAITCREVLSYAAQIGGCFVRFNNRGYLVFDWYNFRYFDNNTSNSIDLTKCHNLDKLFSQDIALDDVVITGIKVTDMAENVGSFQYGSAGYVLAIENNLLIQSGDAKNVATLIGQKIIGNRFRPLTVTGLSDPSIEPGDITYVKDSKGNYHQTVLTNISYTMGNAETFTCDAETASRNSATHNSAVTQTIVSLRNQIQEQMTMIQASADGKNATYTSETKPLDIFDGDLWFRVEDKKVVELLRYDGEKWVSQVSDLTGEEVKALVSAVEETAKATLEEVNNAVVAANNALVQSGLAGAAAQGALDLSNQTSVLSNQAIALAQSVNAQIPTIQSNADSALASAQSALDAYNNIKIGVRNLLFHTSETFTISKTGNGYAASTGRLLTSFTRNGKGLLLENGKTYIIQYDYTIENYVAGVGFGLGSGLAIGAYDQDTFIGTYPYSNYGGNAGKVIYKFTYTGTETRYLAFRPMRINSGNDQNTMVITINNLIIVEGNIAPVDWAPAIEDMQLQFTTINNELLSKISQTTFNTLQGTVNSQNVLIQQNIKDIALKASSVTVDTLSSRVQSAEAGILVNANSITQKASTSDVNVLTGRVSLAESSLITQAGTITALSTLTDGNTTQIGSLQTGYNGLISTVSRVQSDINEAPRNYVLDSGNYRSGKHINNILWNSYWSVIVNNGYLRATIESMAVTGQIVSFKLSETVPSGTTVTLHVKHRESRASGVFNFQCRPPTGTTNSLTSPFTIAATSEFTVSTVSAVATNDIGRIIFSNSGRQVGDYIDIEWVALYVGEIQAAAWQPAPEDVQSQFTSLEQTTSAIQATLINKADSTWVTNQLSLTADSTKNTILNQITGEYSYVHQAITGLQTTVAGKASTAQITLLENQITQTVASLQSGGSNLFNDSKGLTTWGIASATNVVQTQIDETSSPYGKATKFTMNAGGSGGVYKLPAKALTVGRTYSWSVYLKTYTSGNLNIGLEQGGKKSCNVTTEWTRFTHTFVATDSATYAFVFYRNTSSITELYIHSPVLVEGNVIPNWCESLNDIATQSQITQLNTDINLRVTKGDVINQININEKGVLIAASCIQISGDTYIANAVIKAANIASVNASTITTGTLNAATVNVININGNNIVTNSITADKLATNAILVGFNSLSNSMSLTPTSLSFLNNGVEIMRLNDSGNHFYRDGVDVGWIGTNYWKDFPSKKGLGFYISNGQYMSWSKYTASSNLYVTKLTWTADNTATGFQGFRFSDAVSFTSQVTMGGHKLYLGDSSTSYIYSNANQSVYFAASNETAYTLFYGVRTSMWTLCPSSTRNINLGTSSFFWGQIYSSSSTIISSDRNEKMDEESIVTDRTYDFMMRLKPKSYKYIDNQSGRTHYGLIAQEVEEAMNELRISSLDFAGFIKYEKTKMMTVNGIEKEENIGEYGYALRYEEFISPLISVAQIHHQKIEALELKNSVYDNIIYGLQNGLKEIETYKSIVNNLQCKIVQLQNAIQEQQVTIEQLKQARG